MKRRNPQRFEFNVQPEPHYAEEESVLSITKTISYTPKNKADGLFDFEDLDARLQGSLSLKESIDRDRVTRNPLRIPVDEAIPAGDDPATLLPRA